MSVSVIVAVVPGVLGAVGQVAGDAGDDASQRLSMVIIGLVVLAVVITVATIVFWRLTRPEPGDRTAAIRWVPVDPEPVEPPPAATVEDRAEPRVPPAAG